jgi:hypothetical protein
MSITKVNAKEKTLSYAEYISQFERDMQEAELENNEVQYNKLKLNYARVKRLEKTFTPDRLLLEKLEKYKNPLRWLIISEPWCGDSSQNLPLIEKIVENSSNITTQYVLRDRMLQVDIPIPKLYCFNGLSNELIFEWGARPAKIQQMFLDLRVNEPEIEKSELYANLHKWYAADKGKALQDDFKALLEKLV